MKDQLEWSPKVKKGQFRVHARMVTFDHMVNKYTDVDPQVDTTWQRQQIFATTDGSAIKDMVGIAEPDS